MMSKTQFRLSAAVTLAAFAVAVGPVKALAQVESREGIALQNEILELRQQMAQLQQFGSQASQGQSNLPSEQEGSPPPYAGGGGDAVAQLVVRVSALEDQMRTLEGRVSELENLEHRDHDDLAKQIGDLAFKLGQGGAPSGLPAAPSLPPGPGSARAPNSAFSPHASLNLGGKPPPAALPVHRTPELSLKQGNAALARRDYAAAEAAARDVLAGGHGARLGDANFLLARALAGQHQYKDAATTYYGIYRTSSHSPRGAESLLGMSNALIALGDNTPACQALAKLATEFPRPESGIRAGMASARKRAACS